MSAGTVSMNTPEIIWWFGVFPALAAVILAYAGIGIYEWWQRANDTIDAATVVFDHDQGHCEACCRCDDCVAFIAAAKVRIRTRLDLVSRGRTDA